MMKPLQTVPVPGQNSQRDLRLLYELLMLGVQLVAASTTLLERVVRISRSQADLSDLFVVQACSLASNSHAAEQWRRLPPRQTAHADVLRLAYSAARCSAHAASTMRALIGLLFIPRSGTLQFAGEQDATLLDTHAELQQVERCIENLLLYAALTPEQARALRQGVADMAATSGANVRTAIRAAEAADHLHLNATRFIQTLEASAQPPR